MRFTCLSFGYTKQTEACYRPAHRSSQDTHILYIFVVCLVSCFVFPFDSFFGGEEGVVFVVPKELSRTSILGLFMLHCHLPVYLPKLELALARPE